MTGIANERALTAALVAVAKGMGADEDMIKRIRKAVKPAKSDETWLNTRQVMARLGLCKKKVLDIADELGVVRHSSRLLRYPLSRVLEWEEGSRSGDTAKA